MSIAVVCESCERSIKVGDDLAGRKVKCPGCGKVLAVPDEEADQQPPRKRSRDQGEDEDDRPRRKGARKRSKKGLIIGLSVGAGVLAAGLVVLLLASRGDPNATEENFDKVRSGMTREEVEAILGKGKEVPRSEVYKSLHKPVSNKPVPPGTLTLKWKNKSDSILLVLHDGKLGAGWFVREQKGGKVISKGISFGKLP